MPRDDPQDIVIAWVVDDSNPKRNRRENLLSATNKLCGIAYGDHANSQNCTVAVFAAQVVPLVQPVQKTQKQDKRELAIAQMDWPKLV